MYLSSILSSSLFLLLYFYRIKASDVSVSESELFMLTSCPEPASLSFEVSFDYRLGLVRILHQPHHLYSACFETYGVFGVTYPLRKAVFE
jgi:hypothetical protein